MYYLLKWLISLKPNFKVFFSLSAGLIDYIVPEFVKYLTSKTSPITNTETPDTPDPPAVIEQSSPVSETEAALPVLSVKPNSESVPKSEPGLAIGVPTPTELLSASIEKLSKEAILPETDTKEASSAIEAQTKLTQSIASCLRGNQPESSMKDIKTGNKTAGNSCFVDFLSDSY